MKFVQVCSQLLQETGHVTKSGNSNKFKMAAAAIMNSVYRSQLACYCTYLHEIWHVDSLCGPTYKLTI